MTRSFYNWLVVLENGETLKKTGKTIYDVWVEISDIDADTVVAIIRTDLT